ncbi:hypothetical protein ACKWRH_05930 [Bradyrhizobium sp. Pa8]|uniref:hypothetical protein n=1 Tax=Bradyrhizobium sp. Pa8 TaxID=3386552 RepID=UPI00403F13F4
MPKTAGPSSSGGSHDYDDSKVDKKPAGSGGGTTVSTTASGAGSVVDQVGGAATFEALIAQLKTVNQEAMAQDIRLRALSTELSSERKAASERVNG